MNSFKYSKLDSNLANGASHVAWTAIPHVSNNVFTCCRLYKYHRNN